MGTRTYFSILKRIGLSFVLFALTRLIFGIYNHSYFADYSMDQLFSAYVHGFRMDLAISLMACLPFVIATIIPISFYWWQQLTKLIYVVFNGVLLGINIGNWEFFHFIGKKITFDLFAMGGDVQDQAWQLTYNYWPQSLVIMATFIFLWMFYPGEKRRLLVHAWPRKWVIIANLSIFVLTAVGIRGGIQIRSLSAKDAFVHGDYKLGVLSLNASYGFIRSISQKKTSRKKYFFSDEQAKEKIAEFRPTLVNSEMSHNGQNVVLIIMESFCTEYIEGGHAPFYSSLANRGVYFQKHFANGKRSMDALPSLIAGIPTLIPAPLYKSTFQSNEFHALPSVLAKHGYTSWFFHGGKLGTMGFAAYAKSIGFDRYFSMDDYPIAGDFDGHWGIWDHAFFDYMNEELDKVKEPFFTSFFSLSAHQPFGIPNIMKGEFKEGTLPIHKIIKYSDYSLKEFMKKAKTKPWYKNTLFIITADHTHKLETKKYNNQLGWYRVPMLLFHPTIDLGEINTDRITQHADVFPTVLDFLGIEPENKLLFGRSLVAPNTGRAIIRRGSYFNYIAKDQFVEFNMHSGHYQFYKYGEGLHDFSKVGRDQGDPNLLDELKAIIQYGHNGLRKNKLYIRQE